MTIGFPVVARSSDGVAENGVGGEDLAKGCVGSRVLRFAGGAAGVGVVLAKPVAVGVRDVRLARVRRDVQDGVMVGLLGVHGHGVRGSGGGPGRPAGTTS